MYLPPRSLDVRKVGEDLLGVIRNQQCIPRTVLMYLKVEGMDSDAIESFCAGRICCSRCETNSFK